MKKKLLISDPTLRDGSHAIKHQLKKSQVEAYCAAADLARVPVVEIGHGNGLGASSLQVGESGITDFEMIETARKTLKNSKLGIFVLPGFATIKKDLGPAIEMGVDVVRVGTHCTEADLTERHISYAREKGKEVYGALMMTHMASTEILIQECHKMESYGAQGVILMDSAGAYLPADVHDKVKALVAELSIPVGFHAHNNLGMAVANSMAAVESGALMLDGTARGFGAGAGNTPIELLAAVLDKTGYDTGIDLYRILDAADLIAKEFAASLPVTSSISIVSGLAGVFSGFSKHVDRIAAEYGLDPRDIFFELGKKKVVAGQEDLILETAIEMKSRKETR